MGIVFDRILDGFDGPFEKLPDVITPSPGRFTAAPQGGGYVISTQVNDAFVAVNRLLQANQDVSGEAARTFNAGGRSYPAGTIIVPANATTRRILQKVAADKGLTIDAVDSVPAGDRATCRCVRCASACGTPTAARCRRAGRGGCSSSSSSHSRSCFRRRSMKATLRASSTCSSSSTARFPMRDGAGGGQPRPESIPAEFRDWLGSVSVSRTVPELRKFVEAGGRLLAIGSSTAIGYHLGLPIRNALVERGAAGDSTPLPSEKFFVPGSILEARVDTSHPLAYGIPDRVNVFFDDSQAFRLLPDAASRKASCRWRGSDRRRRSRAGGRGASSTSIRRCRSSMRRSAKGRVVLFGSGNRLARAAARHVQVPVQRDLFAVTTLRSACLLGPPGLFGNGQLKSKNLLPRIGSRSGR